MGSDKYHTILRAIDPSLRFRHEVYAETVQNMLVPRTRWLDVGCGNNAIVAGYGGTCDLAVGLDIVNHPDLRNGLFVQADLQYVPLPDELADLVTLRLVVEHMDRIPEEFSDIERVLKRGGRLIILTPNLLSPIVFIAKAMPFKMKKWIIKKVFRVEEHDIFPALHHFNTPRKMRRDIGSLKLTDLTLIEQTSLVNPVLFCIFLLAVLLTNNELLKCVRSNILATFEKA
ncbi:hypothetical protein AMJ71_07925 [candidate division TA06 bacterium SM1_40]|uniref:Methyltransferase type 11 domain-containing protein n=1 Tax=candidate division TA06 bacterium SM1_40 TaxID=1703773 RepID=A0A0S8JFY3_UNCT6|nr:MAG: hypothetical protein AMJ71_07925 [candidate division TA06 bacterium SM1_40]